jgi:DNA-directed RNA polymerase specialized sigma24 family protein
MSTTSSQEDLTSSKGPHTGTFTRLPNQTTELNPDLSQTGLEPILTICLQRVSRWSVPPNWSPGDWRKEAAQVAALAGLEALLEYEAANGKSLDYFVGQRMTSRVRTHHRREWAYVLRFASTEPCSRFTSQCGEVDSEGSDWIVATNESEVGWQEVREAILHLPTSHQSVLINLYWNGYTEMEVGAMLHVSQCAVNKRKQAGLQILRENLRSAA